MLAAAVWTSSAAEKNLLSNGNFKEGLLHWKISGGSGACPVPFLSGGPDGLPYVRLTSLRSAVDIAQVYVKLPKNERFRIVCRYRLGQMAPESEARIVILCIPTRHKLPLKGTPGKWLKFDQEFVSTNGGNFVSFQLTGKGVVDIADAQVIPLSAKSESGRSIDNAAQTLSTPTNLMKLRADVPPLEFLWAGKMPAPEKDLVALFYLKGNPGRAVRTPLKDRRTRLDIKKLKAPAGILVAELQHRESGEIFFSAEYPFRFVPSPAAPRARRLNNLVTELYDGRMPDRLRAVNPRYGWLFFRFTPDDPEAKFSITLNGEPLMDERTLRGEAVRLCEPGEIILVKSSGAAGRLALRAIPDILVFPLGLNDWGGSGRFNWLFAKTYMLPALTTVSAGVITGENIREMQSMGLKWFNNCGIRSPATKEEILAGLENNKTYVRGQCDGISLDEIPLSQQAHMENFAWALRRYRNPEDLLLYTWVYGSLLPHNTNFIMAAVNASEGRGRILHEYYRSDKPTEREADLYLGNMRQAAVCSRRILGAEFTRSYSVILGAFSDNPSISLAGHPQADYKYFLEMQVRMLATEKVFDGLSGVGFWGIHHSDEEVVRWAFALLKHYAIEGKTDMLSKKYGFTYLPGHLRNPDFEEDLRHWEANPLVRTELIPDYGKKVQGRYNAIKGVGDRAAVLRREENRYAVLRQQLTGLVPGKAYKLVFLTADHQDVLQNRFDPGRHPVEVTLDDVEILKRVRIIDRHKPPAVKKDAKKDAKKKEEPPVLARINRSVIVFRAKKTTANMVFDNRAAPGGKETLLNYIYVTPYFEREH